ncbi:MalY/PatB family protein [Vaginisenegalia massiliensis]|uniref:MalY/PatB family protein n=1 Tax=Vaginisenegalia massiliensis TaxID=2058294 RepID=UPI0013DE4886|nr:aminotransferase class I/II-fold pyridoxal phosphate-dependent enzyme [Vaginisenegalia massiliensis]
MFEFDQLADRRTDHSRKWDRKFVEAIYGPLPEDYISMWIADLDFQVAPVIQDCLQEIVAKKTLGYVYTYDEFYQAIQYWQKDKLGLDIDREHILLDYSVAISLYHAVRAFCQADDCIMIQNPVYNPFRMAAQENDIRAIEVDLLLDQDGRYQMDFATIEAQMIQHQPKLFILCSPHNPGGRIWSKEEITRLAQLCLDHGVILVADEVHSDHIYQGEFFSTLALDEAYRQNLVWFNSANKGFNFAGLKTSYAIIPNDQLRAQYQKLM